MQKTTKAKRTEEQVIDRLPSKCEALSSNPSAPQKKKSHLQWEVKNFYLDPGIPFSVNLKNRINYHLQ
jgi:hypothetical protein